MSKSIRIYQRCMCKDSLLACWHDLPDFIIEWFAKNFQNECFDDQIRPFNIEDTNFIRFLEACAKYQDCKQNDFPLREFFKFEHNAELETLTSEPFIQFSSDIYKIFSRKLVKNLFWKFKEDTPEKIETRQGLFWGKLVGFSKSSTDSGFGKAKRWQHNAEYYVLAKINFYGFPVAAASRLCFDIRDTLCEQNNCQRISDKLLSEINTNNKGRKIRAQIAYKYNDEWVWDLNFVNEQEVVKQLDLKR